MSKLNALCQTIVYLSVAANLLSLFVPQKRTKKILNLVLGSVITISLVLGVRNAVTDLGAEDLTLDRPVAPSYSEEDYQAQVAQITSDHLVQALDELLRSEGITAEDIVLSIKITDDGRIYVSSVNIYINSEDEPRKSDIESIVYRNVAKEPEIYVDGQKAQRAVFE